jgi:hypothetical protein
MMKSALRQSAIAVVVVGLASLPGCVSARPWQPTHTVATTFEGERLEVTSGYEVHVWCDDKDESSSVPIEFSPCINEKSRREFSDRITWGSRQVILPVTLHGSRPRPEGARVAVRRVTKRVIALHLGTTSAASASGPDERAWFLCGRAADGDYACEDALLELADSFDAADVLAAAMERRWEASALARLFGASPAIYDHAIRMFEFVYLEDEWGLLPADVKGRAIAAALTAGRASLLRDHWDDLDIGQVEATVELLLRTGDYAFLASPEWWPKLPGSVQTRLIRAAIEAPPTDASRDFLIERLEQTGDDKLRRVLLGPPDAAPRTPP